MRVLITGGLGYVGGRVGQMLAAEPAHDIVLGTRLHAEPLRGTPRTRVAHVRWDSLAGLEALCDGVDTIIHAAGSNADKCAADPVGALEFNGLATARLVQAAGRRQVKRFVYLSTAHVYGSPLAGTITEDTPPASLHPYATSHRAGEDAVREMHRRGPMAGVVIRLSNAYGAPASPGANCWTLLVNDLCRQAVSSGRMVLNSSGRQRRDFVPMTSVCRAIAHLAEVPAERLGNGLFNVGGGWSPTVLEMAQYVAGRVEAATGRRPEVRPKPGPAEDGEPLDYRISKLLGTGFEAGDRGTADREIDALIEFCGEHAN